VGYVSTNVPVPLGELALALVQTMLVEYHARLVLILHQRQLTSDRLSRGIGPFSAIRFEDQG
jgi:hypothetical protein